MLSKGSRVATKVGAERSRYTIVTWDARANGFPVLFDTDSLANIHNKEFNLFTLCDKTHP